VSDPSADTGNGDMKDASTGGSGGDPGGSPVSESSGSADGSDTGGSTENADSSENSITLAAHPELDLSVSDLLTFGNNGSGADCGDAGSRESDLTVLDNAGLSVSAPIMIGVGTTGNQSGGDWGSSAHEGCGCA